MFFIYLDSPYHFDFRVLLQHMGPLLSDARVVSYYNYITTKLLSIISAAPGQIVERLVFLFSFPCTAFITGSYSTLNVK